MRSKRWKLRTRCEVAGSLGYGQQQTGKQWREDVWCLLVPRVQLIATDWQHKAVVYTRGVSRKAPIDGRAQIGRQSSSTLSLPTFVALLSGLESGIDPHPLTHSLASSSAQHRR